MPSHFVLALGVLLLALASGREVTAAGADWELSWSFSLDPSAVRGESREVIVRLPASGAARSLLALDAEGYELVRVLVPDLNIYLLRIRGRMSVRDAVVQLRARNHVLYAQPDHEVALREVKPNDPEFGKQWSLKNENGTADIRATQAWELGTGGANREGLEPVIAIVDGGVDVAHKDLEPNLWKNAGEIAGNGLDDDGNGFVDDVFGWNAYAGTGQIPANHHGTHVAGIAGARGNNGSQITGVNWTTRVMSVAASSGKTSVVAAGYGYVLRQKKLWLETGGAKGANVVATNSSFGVDYADCSAGEYPLWNDLYNALGEAGILSAVATANLNVDVDTTGDVPSGCGSEYLVTVTNTDEKDDRNAGAAFGLKTIHLGAPGTRIWSTLPKDKAGSFTGTSMATPHVAGAVAFLYSVASADLIKVVRGEPARGARLVKGMILDGVDKIPALEGLTVTGGRLNLAAAAQAAARFRE